MRAEQSAAPELQMRGYRPHQGRKTVVSHVRKRHKEVCKHHCGACRAVQLALKCRWRRRCGCKNVIQAVRCEFTGVELRSGAEGFELRQVHAADCCQVLVALRST